MIQQNGAAGLSNTQSNMYQVQQELATGRRISSAATDPTAAGQVVTLADAESQTLAFANAQTQVSNQLATVDTALNGAQNVLQSFRQSLVQAGNSTLSASDRQGIVASMQSDYEQLIGLANSRDPNGNYLFAGFNQTHAPFTATATGARYNGDQGSQQVQVSTGRSISVSVNGADLFQRVPDGNGTFSVTPAPANAGTGIPDAGTVSDSTILTGDQYTIAFSQGASQLQYSVVDQTTGITVVQPAAFSPGDPISFEGIAFNISGAPAAGDTFSVAPSVNRDVFAEMKSAIALAGSAPSGAAAQAVSSSALASKLQYLDQALNTLLSARATVGVQMQELSALKTMNGTLSTTLQASMSALRDVDYPTAVSQYAAAQTAYQAAQASYAKIAQLSLFSQL
jgi:flagellar hook-associated protein 3 FlgL